MRSEEAIKIELNMNKDELEDVSTQIIETREKLNEGEIESSKFNFVINKLWGRKHQLIERINTLEWVLGD